MRRVLWLMIGAVLVPCLVLVWVGTRSVREDRALQEVRTRALTEQTAVLLLRDVEAALADYEQRPAPLLLAPTSGVCALAERLGAAGLAWHVDGQRLPADRPLPEGALATDGPASQRRAQARAAELAANLPTAAEGYREALRMPVAGADKVLLLLDLARVQTRMGESAAARKMLQEALSTGAPAPGERALLVALAGELAWRANEADAAERVCQALEQVLDADDGSAWSAFARRRLVALLLEKPLAAGESLLAQSRGAELFWECSRRLQREFVLDGTNVAGGLRLSVPDGETNLVSFMHGSNGWAVAAFPWGTVVAAMERVLRPYNESVEFACEVGPAPASPPENARSGLAATKASTRVVGLTVRVRERDPARAAALAARKAWSWVGLVVCAAAALLFGAWQTYRVVQRQLELARMRTDFVSNVSHELRTPVTTVRLMSETLKAGRVTEAGATREYHEIIARESERLSRLVDNVLDFARLEEGRKQFQFESVDLQALAAGLCGTFRDYYGKDGYRFELVCAGEGPFEVQADAAAIEQVLFNLLDNAVKYSREESRWARVALEATGDWVTLSVEDQGVGIPEKERERIFEKFYRCGDALTRKVRGSGLGLTLVRQIVLAHGGDIRVESRVGEGSKFSVRLPSTLPIKA
ncbi:MAG: HAMP domain-containing sensor histidine kinase [bacterium]